MQSIKLSHQLSRWRPVVKNGTVSSNYPLLITNHLLQSAFLLNQQVILALQPLYLEKQIIYLGL